MLGAVPSDAAIRADHRCSCPYDDPDLAVSSKRRGDHHIGVRFWDDPEECARGKTAEILVDGVVVHGVFEAILGVEGVVWRHRGVPAASHEGRHICLVCADRLREQGSPDDSLLTSCGICTERLIGLVEFRALPTPEDG